MQTQTNRPRVGGLPKGATLVQAGAEWNETPYFIPGMDTDGEHTLAFSQGETLSGYLVAAKETKAENKKDVRKYICLSDFEGNKFRIGAPAQLFGIARKILENATEGKPAVAITYYGKKDWEGEMIHDFSVQNVKLQ